MRNGLLNGTKCQSTERRGNLFRLLCIARKTAGKDILFRALGMTREQQWESFLVFIQSYLSMEEWFHDKNEKQEVRDAMP